MVALVAVAAATAVLGLTAWNNRGWILAGAAGLALYAASLIVLELAIRVSGASLETDFERGHTALSAVWGLIGLTLLVLGVARRSSRLRYAGLALFGLTLAKIFLFDLSELSSVARAASFVAVGGLLLAGGVLVQRLSEREVDILERERSQFRRRARAGDRAVQRRVERARPRHHPRIPRARDGLREPHGGRAGRGRRRRCATHRSRSSPTGRTSGSRGRRLYARDGLVVSEWTATATHADGRRLEWDGIDVFPFENGLILRKDVYSAGHRPRVLET